MFRLYHHARIHTMDPSRDPAAPIPEALLARDEHVVAVGSLAELQDLAPPGHQRVDLGGAVVLPGLGDGHIHTSAYARSLAEPDLRGCTSLTAALEALRPHVDRARARGGSSWVFGGQWNANSWDVPVLPDRHSLDAVAPDVPVALGSLDWHTLWLNTRALDLLGLDLDTPDPAGGSYGRDAHGELTGILREAAVVPVRDGLMASAAGGDIDEQLALGQRELLRRGVTSIHDIDGATCLAAFQRLREHGGLAVRVHKLVRQEYFQDVLDQGLRTGSGDAWISTGPLKLFADGALGSHTCHMSEAFPDEPGNHGMPVMSPEDLGHWVRTAAGAGIACAVHAIGDRAAAHVLDALQDSAALTRSFGLRHRIEHAQYLRRPDVARMAALGVTASMQPQHCPSDLPLNGFLEGRELVAYGWRTLLRAGVDLVLGSDAPVEDPNPFHGIHAAVTRQRPDGTPPGGWQPHEALTRSEAVAGCTRAVARASGEEGVKGALAPGMLADFVAVDRDPFTEDIAAVRDTVVEATVVGGRVRYRRED